MDNTVPGDSFGTGWVDVSVCSTIRADDTYSCFCKSVTISASAQRANSASVAKMLDLPFTGRSLDGGPLFVPEAAGSTKGIRHGFRNPLNNAPMKTKTQRHAARSR